MSNISALLSSRGMAVADSVYLEREDSREHVLEEYLRALIARLPPLKSRTLRLRRFVARTNALEGQIRPLSNREVSATLRNAGNQIRQGGIRGEFLAQAFAAVREGSRRTLGMRHHDVQLMGGWALMQGLLAEMHTGEGKTLVATLAACTAAAAGLAVHVVTVNDYLAQRDAEQNTSLFDFFGLSIGTIAQGMSPEERRAQYARDIVYVSNKELVFDYLKDRLASEGANASRHKIRTLYRSDRPPALLLRGLHMAIVDEADSVLIDEARTPLIISATQPDEHGAELYETAVERAKRLEQGPHFKITAHREIWITPEGERHLAEITSDLQGVWSSSVWRRELFQKALTALWCFQREQHYIIAEGKVQIVDEFTGRVMPDRSWERGLHQMIEAKEKCEITGVRKTLARMTYQRFFKRYLLLCGMSGTAREMATELRRVYDLSVLAIPTHRPTRRRHLGSYCWYTAAQRWDAVAQRVAELSRQGRPILIGTRSVEASEQLSACLSEKSIEHTVLNARQDAQEAHIVAGAGQRARITVATNMAGRGTDIKLSEEASALGGLHVILTEFHESKRVDRQLYGRSARQGEPGTVEAMVSLEDELFRRHTPLLHRALTMISPSNGKLPGWGLYLLSKYAQSKAEAHNARIRMATLRQDKKLLRSLAFSGTPD